ncbi:MAG: SURF1 family protein [Rhodoferax sp.]|jgi:surfeit locus 1 family protein|nr:SURF1 family protein [Rhodoferax sp.]
MVADYPARSRTMGARFWLVTLAAVLGVGLTARLGLWQLSRAEQKEAMQASIDRQGGLPVLGDVVLAATGSAASAEQMFRRVDLQGRWLASHTVFLDNRQVAGKPGFYVLTPLQLTPSGVTIVVQRGWVQRNFTDRTELPVLATPPGEVRIQGRIAPAPGKLYDFGGAQQGKIRQNLDLARFSAEVGVPLADFTVQQTGAAGDGLVRDWPAIDTGVSKHLGYAFQWFALCALIAGLYLWFQIIRRFFRLR